MRTLEEYMAMPYRMIMIENQEENGGFTVSYPELRGCLTCADTLEQVLEYAVDAKRVWLEAAMEMGIDIPDPDPENKPGECVKFTILA